MTLIWCKGMVVCSFSLYICLAIHMEAGDKALHSNVYKLNVCVQRLDLAVSCHNKMKNSRNMKHFKHITQPNECVYIHILLFYRV